MSDLISQSDAIKAVERRERLMAGDKRVGVEYVKTFLLNRSSVDAAPAVRCKDCIHRGSPNCPMYFEYEGWCEHCGGGFPAADRTEDDGFCHLGKYFEE